MSIDSLKGRLPAYAKDLKLNLSNVLSPSALTAQQVWGAALASAIAARNPAVIEAVAGDAKTHLSPEAVEAAKAAAAIMAMNNIYYRAGHLIGQGEYLKLPARLRMNVIANPGVDKLDFELFSLAVSAVNGCGLCLESHEREVLAKGASKEGVQDALRIAAVIHAVAVTLEGEAALSGALSAAV
jgi:alkyl hydroperoxide reductase subunit D